MTTEVGFAECLTCGHIFAYVFEPKQKYTKRTTCGHMCGERIIIPEKEKKEVKP